MPNPPDILSLLDRIRCIKTEDERNSLVDSLVSIERTSILSFVNAHAVNLCSGSDEVLAAFRASDVILRDGIGVKVAFSALGREPGWNMNGTDFIPTLLAAMTPKRIAVFGTSDPWLSRGTERVAAAGGHAVVDRLDGFRQIDEYVDSVRRCRPDVILLAMGMPRQEMVANILKKSIEHPALIINGGAIVDFLAGRVERAPVPIQRVGLEWLYRLAREPRRLFGRYVIGGVLFAHTVLTLRRVAPRTGTTAAHAYKEL